MPRYNDTNDVIIYPNREESETDRLWRQIDPVLAYAMKRATA